MICPRCGERFDVHERYTFLLWTGQGTRVEGFTYLCADCTGELLEWAGIRQSIPGPPFFCYDERLEFS